MVVRIPSMNETLRVHQFCGLRPGPRLIVLGGVHGDETCGTHGMARAIAALDAGTLVLQQGQLTLVPVANPLARLRRQREGERNLNRAFRPSAEPADYEARIANVLCPLLAAHDVLLDLHSFQSESAAFAMIGPRNNVGALEPFQCADEEGRLALALGIPCVVGGWLDIYAAAVLQRGQTLSDAAVLYGSGTNEYMRRTGGYAVTLECGQHADPAAQHIAWRAIVAALQALGMVEGGMARAAKPRVLRLVGTTDRLAVGDCFARAWACFDPIGQGQPIGTRASGELLLAEREGHIVFPNAEAAPGTEWFYFAIDSDRAL